MRTLPVLILALVGCASAPTPTPEPTRDANPESVSVSLMVTENGDTTLAPRVVLEQGSHVQFATHNDGNLELAVRAGGGDAQHLVEMRYMRHGQLISSPRLLVLDDQVARISIGEGDDVLAFEVLVRTVDE